MEVGHGGEREEKNICKAQGTPPTCYTAFHYFLCVHRINVEQPEIPSEVEMEVTDIPKHIELERPFTITCTVTNK